MAAFSAHPLYSQCDTDPESSLEVEPRATSSKRAVLGASALIVLAIVALVAVCRPQPLSTKDLAGEIVSLDRVTNEKQRHIHIMYGLHKATCPDKVADKSDGAHVTLAAVKEIVGAEKSDNVKFWWVYPQAEENENVEEKDFTPEEQFQIFGGYMYTWGENNVACLALTPKGTDLSLVPVAEFPKADIDWHKPAGESFYKEYSWICPSCDAACKHGCFVYKAENGEKSAFAVE